MHSKTQATLYLLCKNPVCVTRTFYIRINVFNIFPVFSAEPYLQ